jgi:RNA recognition motif-containing protein
MSVKLYVGNLPYSVTSQDLEDLFRPFGPVLSSHVITDRVTGRSRGFGFVELASTEAAEAAIAQLNQREYEGRTLIVNEARPRPERPTNQFGYDRGSGPARGGRRPPRGSGRSPRW